MITGTAVLLSVFVTGLLYSAVFGFDDRFWPALAFSMIITTVVGVPISWTRSLQREKLYQLASRLRETQRELRQVNSSLKQKANYDGMTGLPNREHFFKRIEGLRAECQNSVLLMIDVDHFKNINDSFGHPVGDEALILLAKVFRKILRKDDLVGRIGGEEFGILLPDTSEAEGQIIGEMIRHEIESTKFEPRQGIRHVITVSIGLTHAAPHHDRSHLMRNADTALFEAKRRGRNQVVLFEPGMRSKPRPSFDQVVVPVDSKLTSI